VKREEEEGKGKRDKGKGISKKKPLHSLNPLCILFSCDKNAPQNVAYFSVVKNMHNRMKPFLWSEIKSFFQLAHWDMDETDLSADRQVLRMNTDKKIRENLFNQCNPCAKKI